jgi:hypothetical protein
MTGSRLSAEMPAAAMQAQAAAMRAGETQAMSPFLR